MALDHDLAGLADFGFECRVLSQPPHQHAGAAIDETFGETLVQRIRQLVLDAARDRLPMLGIGKPVRTVGHEGPGPDMRDAVRERVDVAVGAIRLRHLARRTSRPGFYPPASGIHRGSPPARHESPARSCGSPGPGRPPTAARRRRGWSPARAFPRRAQHVRAPGCPRRSARASGPARSASRQRGLQRADRGKVELGVAPLQHLHGSKAWLSSACTSLGLERRAAPGGAERAVAHGAAGAAGDLRRARPG